LTLHSPQFSVTQPLHALLSSHSSSVAGFGANEQPESCPVLHTTLRV
jgi:hypothetical protein